MDDKDKLYSIGKSEIFVKPWDAPDEEFKEMQVVADSLSIIEPDIEEEYSEDAICTNYTAGSYSFSMDNCDARVFDKLFGVGETLHTAIVKSAQIEFPLEPLRKPSNLKYPHKKRKLRIIKKWCKRYGRKYAISSIMLPDATIEQEFKQELDGTFNVSLKIHAKTTEFIK